MMAKESSIDGMCSPKIIHVIGAFVAGGAEVFSAALVEELRSLGSNVEIWALSSRKDRVGEKAVSRLSNIGAIVHSGPTRRLGLRTIVWYIWMLWISRPQIVHLHTPNTDIVHYLAKWLYWRKVTLVRTLHSTILRKKNAIVGHLADRAYRSNAAAASIACSSAVAAARGERLFGCISVIPNGVKFGKDTLSKQHARRMLNLDSDKLYFIAVGRMDGESLVAAPKGHDVLLRAWMLSGLRQRGCQLHLIGDGPLRSELQNIAAVDPSIRFEGTCPDVEAWHYAADVFVMPSRFEGLPIAAIEAIGRNMNCVLSELACLRELEPPAALWVPVDNAEELALQLRRIIDMPPQQDLLAVERFREKFGMSRVAQQYLSVYESAVQGKEAT